MIKIKNYIAILLLNLLPVFSFTQNTSTINFKRNLTTKDTTYLLQFVQHYFYPQGAFSFSVVSNDLKPEIYKGGSLKQTVLSDTIELIKKLNYTDTDAKIVEEIGMVYYRMNDRTNAQRCFMKAISLYEKQDKTAAVYSSIGNLYSQLYNYSLAISNLEMALKKNPLDSDAMAMIPICHMNLGRYDKAKLQIEKNIKTQPDNITNYVMLPMVSFYNLYAKAKNDSIENDSAFYSQLKLEQIVDFTAIKHASDTFKTNYSFKVLYQIARQMALVFKSSFTFSTSNNKFNINPLDIMEMSKLESFYKDGLERKDFPNKYIFYKALGSLEMMRNQSDKAIPLYKEAIKYKPLPASTFASNSTEVYDQIVASYMLMKDTLSAIQALKEKITAMPAINPQANDYAMLGRFQLSRGKISDAENSFVQALKIDNSNTDSYTGLCIINLLQHNMQSAELNINQAYKVNPGNSDLFVVYGILNMLQQKPIDAFYAFQTALDYVGSDDELEQLIDDYFETK